MTDQSDGAVDRSCDYGGCDDAAKHVIDWEGTHKFCDYHWGEVSY